MLKERIIVGFHQFHQKFVPCVGQAKADPKPNPDAELIPNSTGGNRETQVRVEFELWVGRVSWLFQFPAINFVDQNFEV